MKCNHCQQQKSESDLYHYKSRSYTTVGGEIRDYFTAICRNCSGEKHKKLMQTDEGKEMAIRAVRKYLNKNHEKAHAWSLARKVGKQPCEVCGAENTHKHHEDYSKPLEVKWLCPLHHKELHFTART